MAAGGCKYAECYRIIGHFAAEEWQDVASLSQTPPGGLHQWPSARCAGPGVKLPRRTGGFGVEGSSGVEAHAEMRARVAMIARFLMVAILAHECG